MGVGKALGEYPFLRIPLQPRSLQRKSRTVQEIGSSESRHVLQWYQKSQDDRIDSPLLFLRAKDTKRATFRTR